jgi:hypothetical protein
MCAYLDRSVDRDRDATDDVIAKPAISLDVKPAISVDARACPHPALNVDEYWLDETFQAVFDIYAETIAENLRATLVDQPPLTMLGATPLDENDTSNDTTSPPNKTVDIRDQIQENVLHRFPFEDDGSFVLHFSQLRVLDNYFFKTGDTTHWRSPFGNPSDGEVVFALDPTNNDSNGGVVCDVGAFTFKFRPQ